VPLAAEEMDPGWWWVPAEFGCCPRMVDCRAIHVLHKRHGRQTPGRDNVVWRASKGWTFVKRRQMQPECNNGIRDQGLKGQLHLGSKRIFNKTVRQCFVL
jgi:hypothetical protein